MPPPPEHLSELAIEMGSKVNLAGYIEYFLLAFILCIQMAIDHAYADVNYHYHVLHLYHSSSIDI